ncbi:MAG: hypothetical protein ACE14S_03200 [Candidatus Bathyarchaeia archaeon]
MKIVIAEPVYASIMGRPIPRASIEEDQKADRALLERLAKILERLPNLEE